MNTENTIHEYLGFLLDNHDTMKDWGDEGFLENKDKCIIKTLIKRQPNNWTSKMSFNAWKILEKYQSELDDSNVSFDDIEKPDYCNHIGEITEDSSNVVDILKNKFIIKNPCCKMQELFSIYDGEIQKEFNLDNLYKLTPFILNNKININKEYFKFINMFLNLISIDEMYNGFNTKKILNFELKPFQAIGCLYMLLNRRVILGDEMGLGKTIQALASVVLSDQKPCLVICPNILKLNWENEIDIHFKNQKFELLKAKSKKDSDFYIINYESVHNHLDKIKEIGFKSVILDESHYLKNEKAKRTISSLKAIKNIEYRFALTGTAILKTPVELISQLKAINQLDCFGNENDFIEKFCGNSNTQWGKDLRKGASNIDILNRELREFCFIRREKDMLGKDLPDKKRTYIYLNTKTRDYQRKHKEFLLLNKKEKVQKLEELRQHAAKDKLNSSKEWIDNFLETEKKLIVFAYHKEIQNKLIEFYPNAAKITSNMTDKDRDNNKHRFMTDDNCKLIICSLKSSSVGLTLTAASDALFVEMDWCAANNTQAEDRCHRIGQKNNVNIWYLISKGTIEEYILNVVEKKRSLLEKVYKTNKSDETSESLVINDVIEDINNKKMPSRID